MFGKNMFRSDSFKNIEENGKITGFQFDFKIQYYRGITLSIMRDIAVTVDGEKFEREKIYFELEGDTFSQDEMRTVIDYRWKFGQWATVKVKKDGGLKPGKHHIEAVQTIAPSYMPSVLTGAGEFDFVVE